MKNETLIFRESFDRAPYGKSACVFEGSLLPTPPSWPSAHGSTRLLPSSSPRRCAYVAITAGASAKGKRSSAPTERRVSL